MDQNLAAATAPDGQVRQRLDAAIAQVNDVLVEAGPRLSGALLTAGLVDEWVLYVVPKLLGEGAKPLASLPRLTKLDAAPEFTVMDSKAVGPDLRLRLQPKPKDRK